MLRFLFGGLATVAGIVLLFVASFGNPAALLDRVDAVFASSNPSPPATSPRTAAATPPASTPPSPAVHAQAEPPPSAPNPSPAPKPAAMPPVSPPASAPAADNLAVQAHRNALQQQIRQLQAEMRQASQNVTALRSQAAHEREDLDKLQQQRAAEQSAAGSPHAAQGVASAVPPPQVAPAPSGSSVSSPQAKSAPVNAAETPSPSQPVQTATAGPPLPLPPPVPPPAPPMPAASQTGMAAAGYHDTAPVARRNDQVAGTDVGALQSVLTRLRRQQESRPPPSQPMTSRTPDWNGDRATPPDPRQRLGQARAAILSGNVEAARRYLEQAQLQLVFRRVTPYDDVAPGPSRAAGDVASALGALGAGDSNGALAYLDRAMAEARPAGEQAPQSYGYAAPSPGYPGPYGNAPVSQ